ncbi:MAG TPA: DUF3052 domain-containing protein [Acidimicrobiales bacterium]|nr:DUF3052 domain-containing protein [Acidimicrobiales bacterium]
MAKRPTHRWSRPAGWWDERVADKNAPMPAGYSGTPLARKLGVKAGHKVSLLHAPETWTIPELEPGVRIRGDLRGHPDVIVAFVRTETELRKWCPRLVEALTAEGSLWLVWPRKAGGHVSDVTEQSLRDELLPTGLVDTKVAALDDDWSGLRFVWRRDHRPSIARRPAKR